MIINPKCFKFKAVTRAYLKATAAEPESKLEQPELEQVSARSGQRKVGSETVLYV